MSEARYIVATVKPWNVAAFARNAPTLPGEWTLIESPDDLTLGRVSRLSPRYVFFPHWSWMVPQEILDSAPCVCFHMTDLPYGRGGSPLQNLIARRHKATMLTALRMTEETDAGPVYLKRPLDLSGRAQDIFERAADLVYEMIRVIVAEDSEPIEQEGEPTVFSRRRPEQSELPASGLPEGLFDHIRMLDAETYPKAFLHHGEWRLEFEGATLEDDAVFARAIIRKEIAKP